MKFSVYDANGVRLSGGTTTSPGTTNPSTGTTQVINLPVDFGHYWNTNYVANQSVPISKALINQNNNTNGSADAQWQATMTGKITSLAMYEAGPAAGSHSVQIVVNGSVVNTTTMGTGGNGTYFNQPVSIAYNVGDVIKANFFNTASGNTQAQLSFVIQYNS